MITNSKEQGNLGEAAAIFQLTRLGYKLSKPLIENVPYDLIADSGDGRLLKIQVKSSSFSRREGRFEVTLITSGGNRSGTGKSTRMNCESSDFLFVYATDGKCWLIPTEKVEGLTKVTVGIPKYQEYEIK